MDGTLARNARRIADRLTGGPGSIPTKTQLSRNAMRQLAGGSLVVLAAAIVHRTGHPDQQWQYVAIAAALVPQALLDALAVEDTRRRTRLRARSGPAWVPLLVAVALAVAVPASWQAGEAGASALAALTAAVGLGIAAAPVTVTVAPRRRPPGPRAEP